MNHAYKDQKFILYICIHHFNACYFQGRYSRLRFLLSEQILSMKSYFIQVIKGNGYEVFKLNISGIIIVIVFKF